MGEITLKEAPSPAVRNRLPALSTRIPPTECVGPSLGRQSVPTGKFSQLAPTLVPRMTVSEARLAVSPLIVNRLTRPVLVPL
jgi:hypothetical protein